MRVARGAKVQRRGAGRDVWQHHVRPQRQQHRGAVGAAAAQREGDGDLDGAWLRGALGAQKRERHLGGLRGAVRVKMRNV